MSSMKKYSKKIEEQIKDFYNSLSEKERRRYAGLEAIKLGYGGVSYISEILECDYGTVLKGQKEIQDGIDKDEPPRQRKEGGGRKSILLTREGIDEAFLEIIADSTAGSPMDETIKWTNLSKKEIARRLEEKGYKVSVDIVKQLLKKYNFRKRKAQKTVSGKENIENRDEQFKNIERLKKKYEAEGDPVLSMDVKKKS
jgi:hypothetical protein